MRTRILATLTVAALVAGCSVGTGNEEDVIEKQEVPTPDETPVIEPVSPPAEDAERPDEE